MRKICQLFLGLLTFVFAYSSEQPKEILFENIKKEFINPSAAYRSAPLWVWNTEVTYADIDRMLGELKEAGFGGAFVHPRPGLITDYLSEDWFDLYRYSVEVGKKLGLDIWIYDENSYPSGFAGGHVPALMPESYNQGQGLKLTKEITLPDDIDSYSLCLKKEGDDFIDITSQTDKYKNTTGEYYLYKKTFYRTSDWHGGYSYVDLLYPGVTEKFMEVTMAGYEKTFGDELGTVIKGIFTDEPNIAGTGGIRWTPDLFEIFQQQWGYDLKTVLPLLVEETGNYKQVRHNYLETLLQMFIDRWAKPWYEYCENKNLLWTGHYWEHGWPDMSHGADNMAMYAWHQMPAIDMLFNQFNDVSPMAQFGNIRAVKELRSAANQMGYVRTLSETYGGGGWELTFEDMKRLGDWEYVLGVNFMNQHLSHMTLTGARKYDYPPVYTSHSPWWNNYKTQNDYFARLSLVLSQGEQLNDILIIEPTSTVWLYYSYEKSPEKVMRIGNNFQAFVSQLEKIQVEYDLGSENIIKDQGSVKNGEFIVGKRNYKKVVLPPMTENLNKPTFQLIKEFVVSGGELIVFSMPDLIDGAPNEELTQFLAQYKDQITTYTTLTSDVISSSFLNKGITIDYTGSHDLYHHRRTYEDGELLFLSNASLEETITGEFTLEGKELLELDAMKGETYIYPYTRKDGTIKAQFVLPPAGSLLLFSSNKERNNYEPKKEIEKNILLTTSSPLKVKRIKDNVLAIDFCDLSINGELSEKLHVGAASDKLFKAFGLTNGNPWNSSIQYKQTIVEKDTFTTGDIKVEYRFSIQDKIGKKNLRLVAEQPHLWQVNINGTPVKEISGESWLDARWGVYEIGKYIKEGENVVQLSRNSMSIYAEIEPIYITGNFSVKPVAEGWTIQAPEKALTTGSWKQQGLPFYSWEMGYSKNYKINDPFAQYTLQLEEWKGTVAEVFVNNQKVGVIAYQPYEFDLSGYLKKGNNKIEVRVIGSLKNLLGPHHNNPQKGISGPWHWRNVQKPVSGNEYQQLDYGLMKDFNLYSSK